MQSFTDLIKDPKYKNISNETKEEIIQKITADLKDSKHAQTVSQEDLINGLRELIAEHGKTNKQVQGLVKIDAKSDGSYALVDPFAFRANDMLILAWTLNINSGPSLPLNIDGGSGNCGGGGSEGAALAVAGVVCCATCLCCGYCMCRTIDGPDSSTVKGAKITASTFLGLAAFVGLLTYLLTSSAVQSYYLDDLKWDSASYRSLMVILAAAAGLLTSGMVSTINNSFPCPAEPEVPADKLLEVRRQLKTIDDLLKNGWSPREGDNPEETKQFIREAILLYIKSIAAPEVRVEMPVTPRTSSSPVLFKAPEVKQPAPSAPAISPSAQATASSTPSQEGTPYMALSPH